MRPRGVVFMAKKNNYKVIRKHKQGVELVNTKTGSNFTLLNPGGKGKKYSKELKTNTAYTNDGRVKKNNKGKTVSLTKQQRAYRAGYLQARVDAAKAYKAKNK